jgi:hypothetical protein
MCAMDRHMEDRIRKLCAETVAERDPEKARELSRELRTELHNFIEALRARVPDYPGAGDPRLQRGVPSPELSVPAANAIETPISSSLLQAASPFTGTSNE